MQFFAMYIEAIDVDEEEEYRYNDWTIQSSRDECYNALEQNGVDLRTVVYESGCPCHTWQEAEDFIDEERFH